MKPELVAVPEFLSPSNDFSIAIIGTREPDDQQAEAALHLAWVLSHLVKCRVKTGAAFGIDQRAMEGTQGHNLMVFLPWKSYNREIIPSGAHVLVYNPAIHQEWTESVKKYHPAPNRLSSAAFALHARNFGIINKSNGVVAMPNASGGGGTAQGVRIAKALGIPVVQVNRGELTDVARFMGQALKEFGLVGKGLGPTFSASEFFKKTP